MTLSSRAWAFVVAMVVLLGAALRLAGATTLELWSDEARWCGHLLNGTGTWFRPAGYMWLTRQVLDAFGVSEPALRSLSTVAGIALLPVLYLVLGAIVRRRAVALLATGVLCIHPVAVAMSKEFKPYIVEALLHAVLLGLALLALAGARQRLWLTLLGVTSVIAPFFAWTVVFAYPGIYLVVGLSLWRARRFVHLGGLAAGGLATLAGLVGIFLARLASKKPATETWGRKYDVFYVDDGPLGFIPWFIEKTAALASFPARLAMPWPTLVETLIHGVGGVLVLIGAVALFRQRRHRLAVLVLLPWAVMVAFNLVGAWPYGLFRTNTFMLVYTVALLAIGLDAVATVVAERGRLRVVALPLAGVLVVLTLPWEPATFAHKGPGTLTSESSVRAALERIYTAEEGLPLAGVIDDERLFERIVRADRARRHQTDLVTIDALPADAGVDDPLLVLDGHACTSMQYYRDFDDETRAVFGDWLPSHFVTLCSVHHKAGWVRALRSLAGRDFWVIAAKTGWPTLTRKTLAPLCDIDVDVFLPPSTHLLRCRHRDDIEATLSEDTADDDDDDDD